MGVGMLKVAGYLLAGVISRPRLFIEPSESSYTLQYENLLDTNKHRKKELSKLEKIDAEPLKTPLNYREILSPTYF